MQRTVFHDDGKLLGHGHNRALQDECDEIYDIICGSFFICDLGEEDFDSLPEDLLQKYAKKSFSTRSCS